MGGLPNVSLPVKEMDFGQYFCLGCCACTTSTPN